MAKGKIGVTTDNIFPVIKKFLYSDHEIFLRELVSNAIDATQKLKTLSSHGEFNDDISDLKVCISLDAKKKTLTVSDSGIGMTAEEIDKFINQIAFSGAEEFLEKYKDGGNAIIGHFGLGFYSAFMVSDKVEIHSLSYKEGSEGVCWTCDGSPEFEMKAFDKKERGTDIILHISDDAKEFLEENTISALLKKYCRFLPVKVVFGKKKEWKDGKQVDTDEDNVINNNDPAWMKNPSSLKDEDYLAFYRELYPGQDDPLFWIHLNVDYPFSLTGILYFPKIKNNFEINKNRIQLYCNQVFVTDSVEGVVPDFMMLLQGVIDSPDIPLNVSRSYLQSDASVKKISGYITKKVASRLEEIFKNDRQDYENKWEDIKIFIEYGMLTDEKFCDAAMKFALFTDTDKKHFTFDDYRKLIEGEQKNKDGNVVYLYAQNVVDQYSYIKAANDKGYSVLLMDGQLDSHFVGMLEQKIKESQFLRVDSDTIDNLIRKDDKKSVDISAKKRETYTSLFSSSMPKIEKTEFFTTLDALDEADAPVVITQNEFMRRMKEMSALQPGMNFYGEMPDSYNLVVNVNNPIVKRIFEGCDKSIGDKVSAYDKIVADNDAIIKEKRGKKEEKDLDQATKDEIKSLEGLMQQARTDKESVVSDYASNEPLIHQLIDLALLSNGLLKGEGLTKFINRSISLL